MKTIKLKITPGRWEVSQYGAVVGGEYREYTYGFAKSQVALATMSDAVMDESIRDANAELIAEAGTVANETGLTPRHRRCHRRCDPHAFSCCP